MPPRNKALLLAACLLTVPLAGCADAVEQANADISELVLVNSGTYYVHADEGDEVKVTLEHRQGSGAAMVHVMHLDTQDVILDEETRTEGTWTTTANQTGDHEIFVIPPHQGTAHVTAWVNP